VPSDEYVDTRARLEPDPAIMNARSLVERRRAIEAAMAELPIADGTAVSHTVADGIGLDLCTRVGVDDDPWILYFHAGGYRLCSARSYRSHGSFLAVACRAKVLLVDYRLAPEHPFPAALTDGLGAYRWLLDEGVSPSLVVVGGDSAGGGLAASLLLASKAGGLPIPAGAMCMSPWVDLTNSSPTYESNAATDAVFPKAVADEARDQYLQGADPINPLASPVYGDWVGLPPMLIVNSSAEALAGDAELLCRAARDAGVRVDHVVLDEMHHGWQTDYPAYPEAVAAVEEMAAFVRRVVPPE
jgi:monoterpene epsilon-lactone hydrolase